MIERDETGFELTAGATYERLQVAPIETMIAIEAQSNDDYVSLVLNREDALGVALHIIRCLRATAP